MTDQTAQIRTRLKQANLLPDWEQPGAEHLRAAVELTIEKDRQRRFVEDFNGNSHHLRELAQQIRNLYQTSPAALGEIARRRHIHNAPPITGSSGKRSEVLLAAPVGHQGWVRSKYADTPTAPAGFVVPDDTKRSRYERLPDPPRLPNGELDYHQLNRMNGHLDYTGPGASTRAR